MWRLILPSHPTKSTGPLKTSESRIQLRNLKAANDLHSDFSAWQTDQLSGGRNLMQKFGELEKIVLKAVLMHFDRSSPWC